MSTLGKAIQIAATAFKDDLDKGGTPYIMHLLYVMYKVKHLGETIWVFVKLGTSRHKCSIRHKRLLELLMFKGCTSAPILQTLVRPSLRFSR